ncbi:hypothetical protein QE435_004982 [Rhizobium sp. SORGH_AS 787]|nr:hypothetical protein [Rhizobium sp. SORGH_AS_0787]
MSQVCLSLNWKGTVVPRRTFTAVPWGTLSLCLLACSYFAILPTNVQAGGCLPTGESFEYNAVWSSPRPYKRWFPTVKSASVSATAVFRISDQECRARDIEDRRKEAEKALGVKVILVPTRRDYMDVGLAPDQRLKLMAVYPSVSTLGELESQNTVVLIVRSENDLRTPDADKRKQQAEAILNRPVEVRWSGSG